MEKLLTYQDIVKLSKPENTNDWRRHENRPKYFPKPCFIHSQFKYYSQSDVDTFIARFKSELAEAKTKAEADRVKKADEARLKAAQVVVKPAVPVATQPAPGFIQRGPEVPSVPASVSPFEVEQLKQSLKEVRTTLETLQEFYKKLDDANHTMRVDISRAVKELSWYGSLKDACKDLIEDSDKTNSQAFLTQRALIKRILGWAGVSLKAVR